MLFYYICSLSLSSLPFFILDYLFMSENSLLARLDGIDARFDEVATLITDPAVIADRERYVRLTKEYHDLERLVMTTRRYRTLTDAVNEARAILAAESDEEMRLLAREELDSATDAIPKLEEEIKLLLIPADPDDAKNAIVEIRGGTGGDEAALFAADLFRMYQKFAESKGWQVAVSSFSEGGAGGYKEIIFSLSGDSVYGIMKYESGVHRVQRVPATETQGRVHTSAATVAVLPEAQEFDVDIHEGEIRWDTFRSGGAEGRTLIRWNPECACDITGRIQIPDRWRKSLSNAPRPATSQRIRSGALSRLRSFIYDKEHQKYLDDIASRRKTMVSTGDRSAKIRTYNYPQGRMTDHRINYTVYNLQAFLDGDIGECIDRLIVAENAEKLKAAEP